MNPRYSGFEAPDRHLRKGVWTPVSVGLMVLGFVVFWPLGLAVLAHNIWARPGDFQRWMGRYVKPSVDTVRNADDGLGRTWRNVESDAQSFFHEMREGWRRWMNQRKR